MGILVMESRLFKGIFFVLLCIAWMRCGDDKEPDPPKPDITPDPFYFGADLSYVNQILDHSGVYKENNVVVSPYEIFKDHGTDVVRLRLWHNPLWTKEIYGTNGTQLYSDIKDVEKSIGLAKAQGMQVLLDFHYSDTWADPGKQEIPDAWKEITDINDLVDSVYNYTFKTLKYLDAKNLMPEFVQIGNEINCGMLYTEAPDNFPECNACDGNWKNLGDVINGGISAVRDVADASAIKTKIILHVADPKNVEWWFDNIKANGQVTDFDIVGFSYYPLWHTTVSIGQLSDNISAFRNKYSKEVMILETAYPWTTQGNDSYNNLFGGQSPYPGYPYSEQGQLEIMKEMTREVMIGGGYGIIYWEPTWITSEMKDLWGTGSAWENNAFFDYDGNVTEVIDFMNYDYNQ